MLNNAIMIIQLLCTLAMGIYFFTQLKAQRTIKSASSENRYSEQMQNLARARQIRLTIPLSEKTRPRSIDQIVGQEEGLKALRAAICCANPQHVIIYGPPGVGKTCAARAILDEARLLEHSPFRLDAPFIEIDATCVRFDERAIADPLIGSVHDPIYQGAGALGQAGVPQPKEGAVSRANGGVLFLDEIGELHPIQLNKLLKVLEDRRVTFDSAYYNKSDSNTPAYIKDIFEHGMPADFRLIGATTRMPSEISPAIRSRCLEIFFDPLKVCDLETIVKNCSSIAGCFIDDDTANMAANFSASGREASNITQLACSVAQNDARESINAHDILWVASTCRYTKRFVMAMQEKAVIGLVYGLAVLQDGTGSILEIEAKAVKGSGKVMVTGIVEQEEINGGSTCLKRRSTASASVDNALTALKSVGVDVKGKDIHLNFPGGMPVDGPSAGIAIAVAITSATLQILPEEGIAFTGEISIHGNVKPVGGVKAKTLAAKEAGAKRVIVPFDNYEEAIEVEDIEVIAAKNIEEVLETAFSGHFNKNAELEYKTVASI